MQDIRRREEAAARGKPSRMLYIFLLDSDLFVSIHVSVFFFFFKSFQFFLLFHSPFCYAAGIVLEEKNWPPFFPIIHHDISNEIPIHLQRMQYLAFSTWLGML